MSTLQVVVGTYEFLTLGYQLEGIDSKSTFKLRFTDQTHSGPVRCAVLSDRHILATGSTDSSIKLIHLRKGVPLGRLSHHKECRTETFALKVEVNANNWPLDNSFRHFFGKSTMFSASEDGTIVVWDKSWNIQRILRGHTSAVYSFAIHPSGKFALSVGKDKTLRMWNLMTAKCAYVTNIKQIADTVLWSPDGEVYIVVIRLLIQFYIDVYSRETTQITHSIQCPFKIASVVFISKDVLAVGGDGGIVEFHNIISKEKLNTIETNTSRVKSMVMIPCAEDNDKSVRLILATSDGFIKLYQVNVTSSAVTYKLTAEVSTGFQLLSLAAAEIEMKPSAVELAVAAQETSEEKPALLADKKKNARITVTVHEESSSSSEGEGEDDDSSSESSEEDEVMEVKKKKKNKNILRENKAVIQSKKADKHKTESAVSVAKSKKKQKHKAEVAMVTNNKMQKDESIVTIKKKKMKKNKVKVIEKGETLQHNVVTSPVKGEKKLKKLTEKKPTKSEERAERFLHQTKANGKVNKNRINKKLSTADKKKFDVTDLKKHSKPFKSTQRR